ncbi:hypothetical protein HDU98_007176 [Podochytrium sp. JEL0797]|nr:hypothetical protein HDU98_007176 [Podochytrium sp. JEL0797]
MGFLASICKLVGAQTILCELQPFTLPMDTPAPSTALGRAINQIGAGLPFLVQGMFAYLVCTVIPGVIVLLAFIAIGKDGQAKYVDRSKPQRK